VPHLDAAGEAHGIAAAGAAVGLLDDPEVREGLHGEVPPRVGVLHMVVFAVCPHDDVEHVHERIVGDHVGLDPDGPGKSLGRVCRLEDDVIRRQLHGVGAQVIPQLGFVDFLVSPG